MTPVKLQLPLGSMTSLYDSVSQQSCINVVPRKSVNSEGDTVYLLPTGYCVDAEIIDDLGTVRWVGNLKDDMYAVVADKFYSIKPSGLGWATYLLGTLDTSEGNLWVVAQRNYIVISDTTTMYIYNSVGTIDITVGPIGGNVSDTYTLTINGEAIYTSQAVGTALSPTVLTSQINTKSSITGWSATELGGVITLTPATGVVNITIVETGVGFTIGTDGLTVNDGSPIRNNQIFSVFNRATSATLTSGGALTYMDGYYIKADQDSKIFRFSELNNPYLFPALDYAEASTLTRPIISIVPVKGYLWVFGDDASEIWYNAANPSGSPFSKLQASDFKIGLRARRSLSLVDEQMMFYDSRGYIVKTSSSSTLVSATSSKSLDRVSTPEIEQLFSSYADFSQAVATTIKDQGTQFYILTFPLTNVSWAMDLTTNIWSQRTSRDSLNERFECSSTCIINDTQYGWDTNSQLIYTVVSPNNAFNPEGPLSVKQFVTADFLVTGGTFELSCVDLLIGGSYEQFPADMGFIMEFSNDGGRTWSSKLVRKCIDLTESEGRLTWNSLGTARRWRLRFTVTSNIDFSVLDLIGYGTPCPF